jgi:PAS domain S-box-containing protein
VPASKQHRAVGPIDRHFLIGHGGERQTSAITCLLLLVAGAAIFLLPKSTAALPRKEMGHRLTSDEHLLFEREKQLAILADTLHVSITQEAEDGYLASAATLWQPNQWYILASLSLISLGTLLIGGLMLELRRRKSIENELAATSDRLRLALDTSQQLEEKLLLSEERLASVIASSMDAVIAVDQDQRIVLFNEAAAEMFGYNAEKAIGIEINRFIPQRFPLQQADGIRHFRASGVTSPSMGSLSALLAVRANGQEFPIEASISQGETNGRKQFTAIIRDITERKIVEEAVISLSGRLIEAQEEERRRIAREIHDDYNQRLAVIAIDLEELAANGARLDIDAGKRLHGLWNRVSELSEDLHALSHRLHSSTLENLGLIAGVRAFCEEFGEQQGMQVVFAHENVPHSISDDVSLCFFRIVQEALRNVKRHSGANRAEVRLESAGEMLHLSVVDHGAGFNPKERSRRSGIGIRSMEERLRLLGGKLEVQSCLMEGTRIDAWLPFMVASPRVT